jgi:hypothetical protein
MEMLWPVSTAKKPSFTRRKLKGEIWMRINFGVGEVWGSNNRQLPDPGLPDLVVEGN